MLHRGEATARPWPCSERKISLAAGVRFLITFITSIPAFGLFQPVLDDPAGDIAGAGTDNRIGVLFDLFEAGSARQGIATIPEFAWELSILSADPRSPRTDAPLPLSFALSS
jgi:hypothetical protein